MKKIRPNIVLNFDTVSKSYNLISEKPTFFETIGTFNKKVTFTALDKISLKVYRGESIGIIGANGAGKTTLIKLIAGITAPDSGRVSVIDSVVSIIDLSAGFHPDFVGKDNVLLNGLLLGMTKKQVQQNMNSIRKFADIGDHFDAPLYTYSSGMKLRLGFAVAVHADPEILLIDESIMAGDESFQEKIKQKLQQFRSAGKTFIVVSHNLRYITQTAERIIWLEKGKIRMDGDKTVVESYLNSIKQMVPDKK